MIDIQPVKSWGILLNRNNVWNLTRDEFGVQVVKKSRTIATNVTREELGVYRYSSLVIDIQPVKNYGYIAIAH